MCSLNIEKKDHAEILFENDTRDERKMLSDCGYSEKAIKYYMEKPYIGSLPDADQVSEMLGLCGDTVKVFLKIDVSKRFASGSVCSRMRRRILAIHLTSAVS